jgi:hypothetical protein
MARTKYAFEKRQREKAKRLKQIEKSAKRFSGKQRKAETDPAMSGDNSDEAEPQADYHRDDL